MNTQPWLNHITIYRKWRGSGFYGSESQKPSKIRIYRRMRIRNQEIKKSPKMIGSWRYTDTGPINWMCNKPVLKKESFCSRFVVEIFISIFFLVLRSQNYLFSAPAPPWSLISAPAPAIYCHLKLFYNSNTIPMEVQYRYISFFFILASSKLTAVNTGIHLKNSLGSGTSSGSRSQVISAPPAPTPAPQHWFFPCVISDDFVKLMCYSVCGSVIGLPVTYYLFLL